MVENVVNAQKTNSQNIGIILVEFNREWANGRRYFDMIGFEL